MINVNGITFGENRKKKKLRFDFWKKNPTIFRFKKIRVRRKKQSIDEVKQRLKNISKGKMSIIWHFEKN